VIMSLSRPMETSMFDVESSCCCLFLTAVSAHTRLCLTWPVPVECCAFMFDAVARAYAHDGSCYVPLRTRSPSSA
jgi:hypothetical protein